MLVSLMVQIASLRHPANHTFLLGSDLMTRFALPLCNMARPISETVPPVSACLYVADISALRFKQVWNLRKYVQDISKLLSTSYPEVIDRILVSC
jgi:hypothetical protein